MKENFVSDAGGIPKHAVSSCAASSVADILLRAAERHPSGGLHVISGEGEEASKFITYPALLEDARRILGGLRAYNSASGSKVAILLEGAGDFIPAFWACVLGGYIPCPVAPIRGDPERWAKHLAHVDGLLDRPLLITNSVLRNDLPQHLNAADLGALRSNIAWNVTHEARLSDPALLMLTSGSTGSAKAVELTHGNLLASMAGKAESQEVTSADIALNWIAFDHVAALLEVHMIAQYAGASQVHIEPTAILADPLLFLRLIDRYRVSVAFAPNFLLGQVNAALQSTRRSAPTTETFKPDLRCLRYIVTGGEANVVETGLRFLDLLAPCGLARNALRPAFGMTETSAASVYSADFPDCDENREFAAVGHPISGFEVRIVNADEAVVQSGESGEMQVRGSMVFSSYYHDKEATHAAFTKGGWFRTGDLGYLDEGRLRLVGRSKDCIIVSGVNYFSHELETTLESLDGIERSYVAAFAVRPTGADTEQLVIAFATSFPLLDETKLYQLAVAVRNTTIMLWGFRPTVILPLPKRNFPKTSLGKIQRSLMRKRLEAGEYDTHRAHFAQTVSRQLGGYTRPDGEVEAAVAEIYAEILGLEPASLSTTASFFELGGTSLDILKLTRTVLRSFGVEVALTTVLQEPTVRGLAARIARGVNAETEEYDPIIPMQLTGKKTPLFCVHPGNGGVLIFVNLAKYFVNDRPFYALRPRGFNKGEGHFRTFDELVDTYLAAICKRQRHGPYALAGYSVGCPIIFEVAKRLESRGECVKFLGCIDEGPSEEWPPTDLSSSAMGLAFVLELMHKDQYAKVAEELCVEQGVPNPCEYVYRRARRERLVELDLDLPKFSAWAAVAQSNHMLVRAAHVSCGTVESMTVFRSLGWGQPQEWLNHLNQWDKFTRKHNRYIDVAGEHVEIMDAKHVASFQAVLRAEIDRAMEGY